MNGNGFALPRWMTYVFLAIAAIAVAAKGIGLEWLPIDTVTLGYIAASLTTILNFSHSLSFFGMRLHPAFGVIATLLSTAAAVGYPGTTGTIVAFAAMALNFFVKSVTNVEPLPAPASNTVATVTPSTAPALKQGGGVASFLVPLLLVGLVASSACIPVHDPATIAGIPRLTDKASAATNCPELLAHADDTSLPTYDKASARHLHEICDCWAKAHTPAMEASCHSMLKAASVYEGEGSKR